MAAIRGSTGPLVGATSLPWPAGTTIGDFAVLWDVDRRSSPDGWDRVWSYVWSKRLTAGDIAANLPTGGALQAVVVLSSAGGVVRVNRQSSFVRLRAGGVGVWIGWQSPHQWSTPLASATYQRGSTVVDPGDQYRHAVWAMAVASAGTYSPGSVSRHAELVGIKVLPPAAPLAPTWVAPASGAAVDRATPVSLTVAHRSESGASQTGLKVLIRPAGGAWGSLRADGTIAAGDTTVEIPTSSGMMQIAAGQLAVNTSYELAAYTADEGGWSPVSASSTIVARTAPTVAVTLTTAPGDLSPTVSWVTTPGVGSQASWEVRISPAGAGPDAAVTGWTSGAQPGASVSWSALAPTSLPTNGGQVVAWVRVTDSALTSAWTASASKVVSWTPPAAPASLTVADGMPLTLTAAGVPVTSVALDWEWETTPDVWVRLATTEGPAATESLGVPLAPYDVLRRYRVRALAVLEGVRLASAWVTSAPVATTDRCAYLVSEDGREWLAIDTWDAGSPTPIQGHAVSSGFGSTVQRVDRTQVAGWSGWTVVRTEGLPAATALWDWLTGRERIWLRPNPETVQFGEGGPLADEPALLIATTGLGEPERLTRRNWRTRLVRFDWTTQGA